MHTWPRVCHLQLAARPPAMQVLDQGCDCILDPQLRWSTDIGPIGSDTGMETYVIVITHCTAHNCWCAGRRGEKQEEGLHLEWRPIVEGILAVRIGQWRNAPQCPVWHLWIFKSLDLCFDTKCSIRLRRLCSSQPLQVIGKLRVDDHSMSSLTCKNSPN